MQEIVELSGDLCRPITSEEIAQYQEHGWTKLPGFVQPRMVRTLLDIARARMGDDGDSNAPLDIDLPFFNPEYIDGLNHPSVRPLIDQIGKRAKALMGRKPGIEVRYYTDTYAVKLPALKGAKHSGNGRTFFHQDFSTWALDRSGGMSFWIALADLSPASGTMSFVNASHRMGLLGNYHTYGDGDLLEQFPEVLNRCTISEPVSYAAGDATVHSNLTVHAAGRNLTDKPRWAYIVIVNPSDARWNGAPAEAFDCSGLRLHEELDDERFPIIS